MVTNFLVLNKPSSVRLQFKMALLSIASLVSFFAGEQKSVDRGENHFRSSHVESFAYLPGVLKGEVHASLKKTIYKVTVCQAEPRRHISISLSDHIICICSFKYLNDAVFDHVDT